MQFYGRFCVKLTHFGGVVLKKCERLNQMAIIAPFDLS